MPHIHETLHLLRSRSLSNALQDEIERRILAGDYKTGERINELALAQELGISRGPIREACRGLVESRLLTVIVNRGFFVREVSAKEAADVYDVRIALMRVAGETLAPRITDSQIDTLRDLVSRMDAAQRKGDADAYYTLNVEFHDRIVDYMENDRLRAICEGLAKELRLYRRRSLMSADGLSASTQEHHDILEALASKHRFLDATDTTEPDDTAAPKALA